MSGDGGVVLGYLGDQDLSPATVAAAHQISARHLHRLFTSENQTIAASIRAHRLGLSPGEYRRSMLLS